MDSGLYPQSIRPDEKIRVISPKQREQQRTTKEYTGFSVIILLYLFFEIHKEKSRLIERTGGFQQSNATADAITPDRSNPLQYMKGFFTFF